MQVFTGQAPSDQTIRSLLRLPLACKPAGKIWQKSHSEFFLSGKKHLTPFEQINLAFSLLDKVEFYQLSIYHLSMVFPL